MLLQAREGKFDSIPKEYHEEIKKIMGVNEKPKAQPKNVSELAKEEASKDK